MGYSLRNFLNWYTSGGKYKKENEPTHFEKQLDLQKKIHDDRN